MRLNSWKLHGENDGEGAGDAGAGAEGAAGAAGDAGAKGDAGEAKGGTVLSGAEGGEGGEGQGAAAAEAWGDDWRQKYAGEDAKLLKRLERFSSPKAALDSYFALEQKMKAGELLKPLPAEPTDEQLAAYRKDHGIPEKAEAYLEKLPDGLVIGEADKPVVDSFVERAHKHNLPPSAVHDMIGWWNEQQETQIAAIAEQDSAQRNEVDDALRVEWAGDYRANIHRAKNFLEQKGEVGEALMSARSADGRLFLNIPGALEWVVELQRATSDDNITLTGAGGEGQGKSIDDQIAEEEKFMREHRSEYNKDTKRQKRLESLYDARLKLAAKAGKAA